jgi:hypothetical protein
LVAILAMKHEFPIKIVATDISEDCLNVLRKKVNDFNLTAYIEVRNVNLYTMTNIDSEFDVVYTSACIEPVFSLKMLWLAVTCQQCQYILCNHQHCNDIYQANISEEITEWIKERTLFVDAHLDKDKDTSQKEPRNIFALNVVE